MIILLQIYEIKIKKRKDQWKNVCQAMVEFNKAHISLALARTCNSGIN